MFGVVMGVRARHAAQEGRPPDQPRAATGGGAPATGPAPETWHECALTFAALPSTPRWARALSREALRGWGMESLAETVELLLSELVTNAVKAGRQESVIRVTLRAGADRLRVEVADRGAGLPHVDDPDAENEGGRGMMLVSQVSADWGTYPVRFGSGTAVGKVVWCEIPAGDPPAEPEGEPAAGSAIHSAGEPPAESVSESVSESVAE